jgi:hypothetical protein
MTIRREVITYYRNPELERVERPIAYAVPRTPGNGFTLPAYCVAWYVDHDGGSTPIARFPQINFADTLAEVESQLVEPPAPVGKCACCECGGPLYASCNSPHAFCGGCGRATSFRDLYIDGADIL